jgi:hypothetical protein
VERGGLQRQEAATHHAAVRSSEIGDMIAAARRMSYSSRAGRSIDTTEVAVRMEPVKFLVAGCTCVFGVCMANKYAEAQQFVYPVPAPPSPIFNPSSPNIAPQMRGMPVSPNGRQAPFAGNLRPIGQNLRLTIVSTDEKDSASEPDTDKGSGDAEKAGHEKPVDSIGEMYAALRTCWMPPPKDSARHGMEYTVRFALKRDGEIMAQPRVTYSSHDAPAGVRNVYRDAVNAALGRCTPLHLSDRMARAVAGRPIALRFVDNRTINDEKPPKSPQQ